MSFLKNSLNALLCLLGAICFITSLIVLKSPSNRLFYLVDIFSVPILSGTLVVLVSIGLLWLKGLKFPLATTLLSLSALIFTIGLSAQITPKHPEISQNTSSQKDISLMFANLWVQNKTPEKLMDWVTKKDPDIVIVLESNEASNLKLNPILKKLYPHSARRFDMVVFSKLPLKDAKANASGFGLLTLKVQTPQGYFPLAVVHLTRPWPFADSKDQPSQFDRLKRALEAQVRDTPQSDTTTISNVHLKSKILINEWVIAGDFNTTPSARLMLDFNQDLGMYAASGYEGTWPSSLPGAFRMGIDNVLVTKKWQVYGREVGPDYGSDHRPVFVKIKPF